MMLKKTNKALLSTVLVFCLQVIFIQNTQADIRRLSKDHKIGERLLSHKLNFFKKDAEKACLGKIIVNSQETPFIVAKCNPWESLREIKSKKIEYKPELTYTYTTPLKGMRYGAFIVKNTSAQSNSFTFEIIQSNVMDIELFQVGVLPSLRGKSVADPLLPIDGEIKIESGSSKILFFKIKGGEIGKGTTIIRVKKEQLEYEIKITVDVENIFNLKSGFDLNANNWAFLTYPMIKDRKTEAAKDLIKHHINTVVVPQAVLPNLKSRDFSKLTKYLNNFEEIENILIYPNYKWVGVRNGYKGGVFMSDLWKSNFKDWYSTLVETIYHRFSKVNIYFYPYDEVHKPENIKNFKNFILWGKNAIPELKIYATFNNSDAIQTLLPLVDVAQIYYRQAIKELPKHDSEIWSYGIAATSRAISPYSYYRLMAWRAFKYGFKGIGFWNYAAESSENKINSISSPIQNLKKSYSVIYNGSNKAIISTRRWEAFKLGIEDYQIIQKYAKKYGRKKALELVNKVLENKKNYSLASSVKNQMIRSF